MQVYDLSEDSFWVVSGALPEATNRLVGANLGGVFYVLGGNIAGAASKTILAWNPDELEWSELLEGMTVARERHAVTVVAYSDISTHCI